jgi:acyl CoA:acetate/3-ketoacid CoA transferase beta subunit
VTSLNRNQMAWRAAQDIEDGMVVNLGIGIPVLAADHVPANRDVFVQSENGIVGCAPRPRRRTPTPTWWTRAAGASPCGPARPSWTPRGRSP